MIMMMTISDKCIVVVMICVAGISCYRMLWHWQHTAKHLRYWRSFSLWNHAVSTAPVC